MKSTSREPVTVPVDYPASLIFMDESGSRASNSRFFVMSAVKLRQPGKIMRAVRGVRDRNQFQSEFKFSDITQGSLCPYYDLVDQIAASDAHLAAAVVSRDIYDPFPDRQPWQVHLEVASQLLVGCINRRELVGVIMDGISTPQGVALDDAVRLKVNRRFRSTSVVTASCFDSRSNDGLQIADLVASAIAFNRRASAGHDGRKSPSTSSPKAKVARRLMDAFNVADFSDVRLPRVNIVTLRKPSRRAELRVVQDSSA